MALRLALFSGIASIAPAQRADAASAAHVDVDVRATLREFFWHVGGTRELVRNAAAVLVFPSVSKRE
jgi:hypothetical protein